jgi:hypothetical protein
VLGQVGAALNSKREKTDVVLAARLHESISRSCAAKETADPVDKLCRILFARITETVIAHDTEDWPGYYDKLWALVCRVVAQSDCTAEAKADLTRRLIEHVLELEKWWPRLKPEQN